MALRASMTKLFREILESFFDKCEPCGCSVCGRAYTLKDRCTGETVTIYVENGELMTLPIAEFKALPPCEPPKEEEAK